MNGIKLLTISLLFFAVGCKQKEEVFPDPYSGGEEPLGIVVNQQQVPVPSFGAAGTVVSIAAEGLMKHEKDLEFLFNGEKAEIVKVTDKGIEVKVPGKASTGVTAFVVNGQLAFGPRFTVTGFISLDPTFKVVNGTDGTIAKVIPVANGNWLYIGDFSNFDNKGTVRRINRIARTLKDGTYDKTFTSGAGANGMLWDAVQVNSQLYIGGGFSGYAQRDGISNITRINSSGVIDTVMETTYTQRIKYVPTFNGGTNGTIRSLYTFNNKVIATGDFQYYVSRRYDQPSRLLKDSTVLDSVEVRQLVRFNLDGTLDKTWRFDPEAIGYKGQKGKSLPGGSGRLSSLMQANGKILAYGMFNRFDEKPVGYIVRLNVDGTIDETFNTGGAGADNYINHVSFNEKTRKFIVLGIFKTFNGKPAQNMVVLNENGSVDESFTPEVFGGGVPSFAKQLDSGLIFVSGGFKTYAGTNRQGFLMLNPDGEMADGYNTIGNLLYNVLDVKETVSEDDKPALIIVGAFNTFNDEKAYNMVRVVIDKKED